MVDYKNIVPFIKKAEGGLSSDPKDSASKNPSPCGKKNGYPIHTNKGITWNTFNGLAKKGGYSATCQNFLNMPDSVWLKVYKAGYWDAVKGDKIKNQAIANVFVEMAWGSGLGCSDYTKCFSGVRPFMHKFFKENYNKNLDTIDDFVNYVNKLDNEGKTPELFEKLHDFIAERYTKMPTAKTHLKGWLNRLNAFYLYNKRYAVSKKEKSGLLFLGIGLIALGGAYIYVRTRK
jgi:lysozyme family protein